MTFKDKSKFINDLNKVSLLMRNIDGNLSIKKEFKSKCSISQLENKSRSNLIKADGKYAKRDLGKELNTNGQLIANIIVWRLKKENKGKPFGYKDLKDI